MSRILAFAVAIASASSSGCVASEVCADREGRGALPSSSLSGEQTFTDGGEEGSVHFRATLRGLSELWPAEHAVQSAGVTVSLQLDYADASATGGVATQMPRFGVNLASATSTATSYAHATPGFPPATGVPFHLPVFHECFFDDDVDCCEYGSTECSLGIVLRFVRREGEPFPPVVLRWSASLSAIVDTCPLADNAELLLELEEP